MNRWRALAAAVAFMASLPAHGMDRLVGSASEFAAAVKAAKPGDRIILREGVWNNFDAVFEARGTAERPITLTAQKPGRVIFSGQSRLRLAGAHLVVSGLVFRNGYSPSGEVIAFRKDSKTLASDSRLTDVVIDNYNAPKPEREEHWVTLYGQNNRVDHSHFANKTNEGVTLVVVRRAGQPLDNRHRIDHNYFGPRPLLGKNGGETIRIGTSDESLSASNTVVERNLFEECDGEAEIISVKSGGNILRENLVVRSQGAFVLRHGNGNVVERNIFLNDGKPQTGGIRVINRDQIVRDNYMEGLTGTDMKSALAVMNGVPNSALNRYHQVANATISNNSVIYPARITLAAGADAERTAPPIASRFERNLIISAKATSPLKVDGDISGIAFSGNIATVSPDPITGSGFAVKAVALERAANGLLYPSDPALAGLGAPRDLKPVARDEVGVSWYRSTQSAK